MLNYTKEFPPVIFRSTQPATTMAKQLGSYDCIFYLTNLYIEKIYIK